MTMNVSLNTARSMIVDCIKANLTPMVKSSPGLGKSAMVKSIAEEFKLKLIDLRLSQCDPTDVNGFPDINKETNRAGYVPMETFPLEGDEIPDGYNGWLLFLDELPNADQSVIKASYKLILDRMIGNVPLHKNVVVVAAGNLASDNALVDDMGTAMASRLIHINAQVDVGEWLMWANQNHIDGRITSFINFKKDMLHKFNPELIEDTFPCPRTWQFASDLIKGQQALTGYYLPLLAGTIGEGAMNEFLIHSQIFLQLITIDQIIAAPTTIEVPTEPSIKYALTGSIAQSINDTNAKELIQFLLRLPPEFQVICGKAAYQRNNQILDNEYFAAWFNSTSFEIF